MVFLLDPKKFSELDVAAGLDGTELVPIVQGGDNASVTVQTIWDDGPAGGGGGAVDSVNGQIGVVVLDQDDIADGSTNKQYTTTEKTKLAGIETAADVTDATNVDAAGATMNTDTTLAGNGYFLDEDSMASNSATKVPSQQSVKAYVDAEISGVTSSGGITRTIVTVTSTTTGGAIAARDYTYLLGADAEYTQPTAVGNTNRYTLKNISAGNLSIASTSAQTFDGGALVIAPDESVELISDNTNWRII